MVLRPRSIRTLLLALLAATTGASLRAQDTDPAPGDPSPARVTARDPIDAARLDELQTALEQTGEEFATWRDAADKALESARGQLRAEARWKTEQQRIAQRAEGTERAIAELESTAARLRAEDPSGEVQRIDTLDACERAIDRAEAAARAAEERAAQLAARADELSRSTGALAEELRNELASLGDVPGEAEEPELLQTLRSTARQAERQAVQAHLELLEALRNRTDPLLDLNRAERNVATAQIEHESLRLEMLRDREATLRKQRDQAARDAARELRGSLRDRARDPEHRAALDRTLEQALLVINSLPDERDALARAEESAGEIGAARERTTTAVEAAKNRYQIAGLSMGVGAEFRRLHRELLASRDTWSLRQDALAQNVLEANEDRFADEARQRELEGLRKQLRKDTRAFETAVRRFGNASQAVGDKIAEADAELSVAEQARVTPPSATSLSSFRGWRTTRAAQAVSSLRQSFDTAARALDQAAGDLEELRTKLATLRTAVRTPEEDGAEAPPKTNPEAVAQLRTAAQLAELDSDIRRLGESLDRLESQPDSDRAERLDVRTRLAEALASQLTALAEPLRQLRALQTTARAELEYLVTQRKSLDTAIDLERKALQTHDAVFETLATQLESRLGLRRTRAEARYLGTRGIQSFREEIDDYLRYVDERILWVRNAPPIWASASRSDGYWKEVSVGLTALLGDTFDNLAVRKPLRTNTWLMLGAALVLGLLRRRIRTVLERHAKDAGRRSNTSIAPSLKATALLVLLAAPLPLCTLAVSRSLVQIHPSEAAAGAASIAPLTVGLAEAAFALWLLAFLRAALAPRYGLAIDHLRWREDASTRLRRTMVWLAPILVFAAFALTVVDAWERAVPDDARASGRITLLISSSALLIFGLRSLHPVRGILVPADSEAKPRSATRRLIFATALVLPVGILFLALLGYLFTARAILMHYAGTLLLVAFLVLGHSLLIRWMKLARRSLALQRAKDAHRLRASQVAASAIAEVESSELEELDQQTRTLVTFIAVAVGLLGAWSIWDDTLPALGMLERIWLWPARLASEADLTDTTLNPLTLPDVLAAAITATATWLLARNIGGLLDVALLRRLKLGAGERYAIRTITRYAVAIVGMALAFGELGIGWDSVQWLAAGVSVGLGFGLQEIFGNFMSGLILLIERPMRVGDVVTVDGVDGTVTRIEMRSTTITDWDRKELVIPNKEFITKKLSNWSLSNAVTRLVLPVGIAYGSDTRRARELLLEAANECSLVLAQPAPMVDYFSFGASSLDFRLRCYIADIDDRMKALSALHYAIDDAFRAAEIEIAFPQQDLHVRSLPAPSPDGAGLVVAPRTEPLADADRASEADLEAEPKS